MRTRPGREDAGATLVEMTVAMVLFGIIGSLLLSTFLASRNAVLSAQVTHNLNEEARVALNRISRELRQAKQITAVSAPDGATSITFGVDFNGLGGVEPNAADPEILTYSWNGSQILLTANNTSGVPVTHAILAGNVSDFRIDYFSSDYRRDCATPKDGRANWRELDAYTSTCGTRPTTGHSPGVLDTTELNDIDTITITLRVLQGSRSQEYRTQVDLRNAR